MTFRICCLHQSVSPPWCSQGRFQAPCVGSAAPAAPSPAAVSHVLLKSGRPCTQLRVTRRRALTAGAWTGLPKGKNMKTAFGKSAEAALLPAGALGSAASFEILPRSGWWRFQVTHEHSCPLQAQHPTCLPYTALEILPISSLSLGVPPPAGGFVPSELLLSAAGSRLACNSPTRRGLSAPAAQHRALQNQ